MGCACLGGAQGSRPPTTPLIQATLQYFIIGTANLLVFLKRLWFFISQFTIEPLYDKRFENIDVFLA